MTIDEAIVHAREVATIQRNNKKLNDTLGPFSPYYNQDCVKCAQEHDQLAEWLEELKQYRAIGTPEECQTAMEKQKKKSPIRLDKCTCPSCGTYNEVWKKRRNTLPSDVVHCWHCGQAVEIFREGERWED